MTHFLSKELSDPIRRQPTGYVRRQNKFYDHRQATEKPPSHSSGGDPAAVFMLNRSPSPMDVDPPDVPQGSRDREGVCSGFRGQDSGYDKGPQSNTEEVENVKLKEIQAELEKGVKIMAIADPPVQLEIISRMEVLLAAARQEITLAY
ncbi:hypothetical protein VKT23_008566 [Stygiomarasmius scandens]|uniref:Uncharacterized protein n=1 Tax=Marasmiellus scandens TaxID=2682957 RepID=A0ABR1JJL0_9AGAR